MAKKLRRKIYLVNSISDETYLAFSKKLTILEKQASDPIELELFSSGGDAYSALAFASRIRNSPCEINVFAHGLVASAAVLVLAAGDYRSLAKEAWVMVHEDSGKITGSATGLKMEASHMIKMEDQWAELLAERSLTSAEEWRRMHKDTKYLTAVQCLDLGLIEAIV